MRSPIAAKLPGTNRSAFRLRAALFLFAFAALTGGSAVLAQAEATAPVAGYADPDGPPLRPATPDIEPIYRAPGIDTMAMIRTRGVLRVGVAASEPTVLHDAKGELVGFSIDLARKLAEDLGVEVVFVETSWEQLIPDLLDRHFDLIASGMWVTPERALVVNFSRPTATEGIHLIASKTLAAKLKSLPDFNRPEVRIAVFAGSTQEKVAQRLLPNASLVRIEGENADQLTPVLEGKVHAALVPTFAPAAIVRMAPDKLFLPLPAPLRSTITAVAVRKGDPDFLNYIDSWLAVRQADGWFGEREQYWTDPANWLK